jgi:hypothetical protein
VRQFLFFDVAIRGIDRGLGDVIPLGLLATAVRLLLALLRRGRRLNKPGDVRYMDRVYHIPLIGRRALEL